MGGVVAVGEICRFGDYVGKLWMLVEYVDFWFWSVGFGVLI
jgi:hypothetical protein